MDLFLILTAKINLLVAFNSKVFEINVIIIFLTIKKVNDNKYLKYELFYLSFLLFIKISFTNYE